MAQTTKWLPAILDYMKNMMSSISTSHPNYPPIPVKDRSFAFIVDMQIYGWYIVIYLVVAYGHSSVSSYGMQCSVYKIDAR